MRKPVTLDGVVTSLTLPAAGSNPVFHVDIRSDQGPARIAFVGYRSVAGFSVGRHVEVTGVVTSTLNGPTIFNPLYTLKGQS